MTTRVRSIPTDCELTISTGSPFTVASLCRRQWVAVSIVFGPTAVAPHSEAGRSASCEMIRNTSSGRVSKALAQLTVTTTPTRARKTVVEGKSVAVRVDLGGGRTFKKKRPNNNKYQ